MKTEHLFPIFVGFTLTCSLVSRAAERADDTKPEAKPVTVTVKS